MAVEGILLICLAVWYVWLISEKVRGLLGLCQRGISIEIWDTLAVIIKQRSSMLNPLRRLQVTHQRYLMYSCFIQIPQATIRSLALRPIGLNDEDDDEDAIQTVDEVTVQDDFKQNQQHEASGDGKGRDLYGDSLSKSFWDVGDKGHIPSRLDVTLNIASSEEATPNGVWSRFTSLFARRRGRPLSNGKRKIQPSRTAAILMVSLLGVKRSTLAFSSHAGSQDVGRIRELNVFPYFPFRFGHSSLGVCSSSPSTLQGSRCYHRPRLPLPYSILLTLFSSATTTVFSLHW